MLVVHRVGPISLNTETIGYKAGSTFSLFFSEYQHQKSKILRSERPKNQKYSEIYHHPEFFRSISIKNQKYSGAKDQKIKNTPKFIIIRNFFGVSASKIKNTPERKTKKSKILRKNNACHSDQKSRQSYGLMAATKTMSSQS